MLVHSHLSQYSGGLPWNDLVLISYDIRPKIVFFFLHEGICHINVTKSRLVDNNFCLVSNNNFRVGRFKLGRER